MFWGRWGKNAGVSPATLPGYDSTELASMILAKTKALDRSSITKFAGADRTMLAVLLADRCCENDPLNVLDFGGACGMHKFVADHLGLPIKWAVVETPLMAKAASQLASSDLKFFETITGARAWLERVDLIWASSSLQYAEAPQQKLSELIAADAKVMAWTRMALSDGELRIVRQKSLLSENGPGPLPAGFRESWVNYEVTHFPRADFLEAHRTKYDLVFELSDPLGFIFKRR